MTREEESKLIRRIDDIIHKRVFTYLDQYFDQENDTALIIELCQRELRAELAQAKKERDALKSIIKDKPLQVGDKVWKLDREGNPMEGVDGIVTDISQYGVCVKRWMHGTTLYDFGKWTTRNPHFNPPERKSNKQKTN